MKKKALDYYLIVVTIISAFMELFLLNKGGSNEYYTVAVKSMTRSFHNFFFASFDPAGFITVDKPPVALWLQTLSAKIFGVSNLSVNLPEALAAIVSTMLIYLLIKKKTGKLPAFIGSLAMATTPIFVAVTRTNNVDSILILTLVLAAWFLFKAEGAGKLRWLVVSVLFVGIGFNTKMLEAYLIVPAVYLFYLVAMKISWKKKIVHLLVASVVLALVSLSWSVVVDSISASDRPYVGSSQINSELELAFGYNGIARLTGQQHQGMGQGNFKKAAEWMKESGNQAIGGKMPQGMSERRGFSGTSRGTRGGNMFNTGTAGPLRLFQKALSGQASWLFPFVLFGVIALVSDWLRRRQLTEKHTFAIFWLMWLVTAMGFFSVAGFFHQYYLSIMAPAIAALIGVGASLLIPAFMKGKEGGWESFLLPSGLAATLLFEALIFSENSISTLWIVLLILAAALVLAFGLLWRTSEQRYVKGAIVGAGLTVLFLPPLYWAMPSVMNQTETSTPIAGPSSTQNQMGGQAFGERFRSGGGTGMQGGPQMGRMPKSGASGKMGAAPTMRRMTGSRSGFGMEDTVNTKLLTYLRKHYHGEKYILAVQRAQSAYSIMLKTNYAVMAMGGFGGSDPALTVSKLEKLVKDGDIKYFLISEGGMGGSSSSKVTTWIKTHCQKVPTSDWSSASSKQSTKTAQNGMNGQSVLYVYEK
ncbi:MAG: glycosyltransferase family 39 protein [Sporolactobacillus sp.]